MRWLFVVGVLFAIGCTTQSWQASERDAARKELKTALFCPDERITTTRHPELVLAPSADYMAQIESKERPPWVEPTPPPGVANDPSRYRLWYEARMQQFEAWKLADDRLDPNNDYMVRTLRVQDVVVATGCGETHLYACAPFEHRCTDIATMSYRPIRVTCREGGEFHASPDGGTVACDRAALNSQAAR